MGQPIPEWWCKAVVKTLNTFDSHVIVWTGPAFQHWLTDTFGAFKGEAYDSLIEALSTPGISGNETTSLPGQKAVYEFLFFYHQSNGGKPKLMYGKIALLNDGIRILILSAHNAERSTL